jgi:Protein of unknown function (DUF2971)
VSHQIPTLYKYVSSLKAVENMLEGKFKFATIKSLNDPNEMLSDMNEAEVSNSRNAILENGYTEEQFLWLHAQAALLQELAPERQAIPVPQNKEAASSQLTQAIYGDNGTMKAWHEATVTTMQARVGILSLSQTFQSFPMWAHYADNAQGFVLQLKGLENEFGGNETASLSCVKPVEYLDVLSGMTFDPQTQDRLFFAKQSDWSYEREWRVVLPLSSCEREGPDLYIKKVPTTHVNGVICGWRCSDEHRQHLEELTVKHGGPRVSHATIVNGIVVHR